MNFIAFKMLLGDRAKYIGIVIGLTFASFLVTWPSAIFSGVMSRSFSFVTDVGLPNVWVVNPQVQYIEDIKPFAIPRCCACAERKECNGRSAFIRECCVREWRMARFKAAASSAWMTRH